MSSVNAITLPVTGVSVPGAGGPLQISVSAGSACTWTATTTSPFLTIIPGSESGTGGGTVNVQVQPNPTADSRTGTVTIAGLTFVVSQANGFPGIPATGPAALSVPAAILAIAGAVVLALRRLQALRLEASVLFRRFRGEAWDNSFVSERRNITIRKYRLGEEPRVDADVLRMTVPERWALQWEITKTGWAFKTGNVDEPRFRRDVARVIRRRR